MKKLLNYLSNKPISPLILFLFFTILGAITCILIFEDSNYAVQCFISFIGLGLSAAIVQCSLIQNSVQKDNIKISLFEKRYTIFQTLLDTITIIKRDNWDRYILFKGNDINYQMIQAEENLYKSTQLASCLFDRELCIKLNKANNAFCKVIASYKNMLTENISNLVSSADLEEFIHSFNVALISDKHLDQEYDIFLKNRFPKTYISILNFNKECADYLSFINNLGIIKDINKYLLVDDLGV